MHSPIIRSLILIFGKNGKLKAINTGREGVEPSNHCLPTPFHSLYYQFCPKKCLRYVNALKSHGSHSKFIHQISRIIMEFAID